MKTTNLIMGLILDGPSGSVGFAQIHQRSKRQAQVKYLSRTIPLLVVWLGLFLQPAHAQPVVDNSLGHSVGAGSPTNSGTSYSPTLSLPPGSYNYVYSTSGGSFLGNIFLHVNFNAWTSGNPILLNSSPNVLGFNFYVPPSIPLCSSETIHIRFFKKIGLMVLTVGTFDLTVVITENGEKKNITYVNGVSKLYYVGDDYKAHSLTWTPGWNYAAINPVSGWGTVQIDGQMAAFANGSRIFFKGKDNKLYNLVQSGTTWTLSQVLIGLPNVAGSVAARNNDEVVFYGSDGNTHQLFLSGTTWTDHIVMPTGGWGNAGGPNGRSINLPAGSTRIFFANGLSGLSNVYLSGGSWVLEQISPQTVPWNYLYDSDLLAVEDYAVYYVGRDNFIHRYTKCGPAWTLDAMPISAQSENNVIVHGGHLTKFSAEDRVFYKAATGRIYNLYAQYGTWYNYPLDNAMTSAAGDLFAAEGHIFYINQDKRVHNFIWNGSKWNDGPLSTSAQANTKACINPYYY